VRKKVIFFSLLCLILFTFAQANDLSKEQAEKTKTQTKLENPAVQAMSSMLDLLGKSFNVKKLVGDPVKIGNVTIIPIMMIDIGYGGGGGGMIAKNQMAGSGFYMSGEARPLGFIVIGKSGTKFLIAGKAPRE
jgi:uncharacterized spore protein YtfJ